MGVSDNTFKQIYILPDKIALSSALFAPQNINFNRPQITITINLKRLFSMFLPVSPMKEQKRGAKSIVPAPVVPQLPFIVTPHSQPEEPLLLIAESNIAIARKIKQHLELTGKSVMLASSGVEGLMLGLKEPFDLIVFNTTLDSFNGLELIRLLRSSGRLMPAIAMVEADFDPGSVPVQCGVSCFINKPVDIQELQEKIVGLLGQT